MSNQLKLTNISHIALKPYKLRQQNSEETPLNYGIIVTLDSGILTGDSVQKVSNLARGFKIDSCGTLLPQEKQTYQITSFSRELVMLATFGYTLNLTFSELFKEAYDSKSHQLTKESTLKYFNNLGEPNLYAKLSKIFQTDYSVELLKRFGSCLIYNLKVCAEKIGCNVDVNIPQSYIDSLAHTNLQVLQYAVLKSPNFYISVKSN